MQTMFYGLILFAVIVQMVYGHLNSKFNVPDLVNEINNQAGIWKAHTYGHGTVDMKAISRSRLGLKTGEHGVLGYRNPPPKPRTLSSSSDKDLPSNFSWLRAGSRNYGCPIDSIRDQSQCGSCWAVSTASAFSDRVCMASKGKFKIPLSDNNLCGCEKNSYGCSGGYMDTAHAYLTETGLITGGQYESDIGCQPYYIRPCGGTEKFLCIPTEVLTTPKCNNKCTNDWYTYRIEPKTVKADTWYNLPSDERAIRQDIYENGPVTAAFSVRTDFIFYKEGIYVPNSKYPVVGGHAVRVVGWGTENGTNYWQVANSWGESWGENGYFRIIRGINACGFESEITAAIPVSIH